MEQQELRCLNIILKGEYMAIGVYDEYIENPKHSKLKDDLIAFRQEHIVHALRLTRFIEDNGGIPDENTGWRGFFTRLAVKINSWRCREPAEILRILYQGEDRGLTKAEQISSKFLAKERRKPLEKYFQEKHKLLDRVYSLMHRN